MSDLRYKIKGNKFNVLQYTVEAFIFLVVDVCGLSQNFADLLGPNFVDNYFIALKL